MRQAVIIIILIGFIIFMYLNRKKDQKKYSKELEDISDKLELALQNKKIIYSTKEEDTLYSKIMVQIQRIDETNRSVQKRLQEDREGMRKLLSQISHQIRTPLTNFETYMALLEKECKDDTEKLSYVEAMKKAEKKISFLVGQFILAARMENQLIQIHKVEQDIKETVATAIFQVYQKAEKKNLYINVREDGLVDKVVKHDKNWICEGLYNLLDNSIKYSPEGSTIIVAIKNNEMFTEISVEDEGIGIEQGEENKIFQLYYRGSNISNQEGYGLGMFITNQIIKKHDGFMRVKRNEPGLTVSFFLPKTGT